MQDQFLAPYINSIYLAETVLKALFVFMSLFDMQYTIMVGCLASVLGVVRVCKIPEMNKAYMSKVIGNNHGQNILYMAFGSMGHINYLYYSPVVLFFGYGIVEFIKLRYPQNSMNLYCDLIRTQKHHIMHSKHILEISFFVYLLLTFPLAPSRAIKAFVIAQLLLLKYKVNQEFRQSCTLVNNWII